MQNSIISKASAQFTFERKGGERKHDVRPLHCSSSIFHKMSVFIKHLFKHSPQPPQWPHSQTLPSTTSPLLAPRAPLHPPPNSMRECSRNCSLPGSGPRPSAPALLWRSEYFYPGDQIWSNFLLDLVTFKLNVTMIARMPVFLKLFKTIFQKNVLRAILYLNSTPALTRAGSARNGGQGPSGALSVADGGTSRHASPADSVPRPHALPCAAPWALQAPRWAPTRWPDQPAWAPRFPSANSLREYSTPLLHLKYFQTFDAYALGLLGYGW